MSLHSTGDLAAVLRSAGSKREPKEVTKRSARVFQALRIEVQRHHATTDPATALTGRKPTIGLPPPSAQVNQEMSELERILNAAARLVRPGGRLAVMSYHSLEDRRVKRLLRSGGFDDVPPPKDVYGNVLAP